MKWEEQGKTRQLSTMEIEDLRLQNVREIMILSRIRITIHEYDDTGKTRQLKASTIS